VNTTAALVMLLKVTSVPPFIVQAGPNAPVAVPAVRLLYVRRTLIDWPGPASCSSVLPTTRLRVA